MSCPPGVTAGALTSMTWTRAPAAHVTFTVVPSRTVGLLRFLMVPLRFMMGPQKPKGVALHGGLLTTPSHQASPALHLHLFPPVLQALPFSYSAPPPPNLGHSGHTLMKVNA